jgi:hypothetical protein
MSQFPSHPVVHVHHPALFPAQVRVMVHDRAGDVDIGHIQDPEAVVVHHPVPVEELEVGAERRGQELLNRFFQVHDTLSVLVIANG